MTLIRRTRGMPSPQADGKLLPVQIGRWRRAGRLWTATPPPPDNPHSPLTTSVLFDGVAALPGESINYGAFASANFERTDNRTVIVWIKSTSTAQNTVIAKGQGSLGWHCRVNSASSGDFRFSPRSGLSDVFATTVPSGGAPVVNDGNWHMLGLVLNGNSPMSGADLDLYIDGVQMTGGAKSISGASTSVSIQSANPLLVANVSSQLDNFPGNICHPAIFGFSFSPANMLEAYGLMRPQALLSMSFAAPTWWSAVGDGDGLGAGEFLDLSGNGNHGTQTDLEIGDFVLDVPP